MRRERFLQVTLTTQAPLHIGGPDDPLATAKNVVSKVGDRVVIPGPTLKGALRAELEQFLIDQHFEAAAGQWAPGREAARPCIPAAEPSKDERKLIEGGRYSQEACRYTSPVGGRREGKSSKVICPCCYLLGAMGIGGFLRVPFLDGDAATNQLYSAGIDRATGTVRAQTNRPYELVPAGAIFTGKLSVLIEDTRLGWQLGRSREFANGETQDKWLVGNPMEQDRVVQDYVVARLQSIALIGGYKSKGFGEVSVKVEEVQD